jgi:hypothetical protein
MGVSRWCDSALSFTHFKLPQVRTGHQAERPATEASLPRASTLALHRLLGTVETVTDDEKRQLDMWWARLSQEQRDQCWSFDPNNPLPTGHPLWTQPLLDLTDGLAAHPPGFQVDPRVAEFLNQKRLSADL